VELVWTAPAAGSYRIDTTGTAFDTVLYVTDGATCGGIELECNDDVAFGVVDSIVTVTLSADQAIVIHVDGFDDQQAGDYTVAIEQVTLVDGGSCCIGDSGAAGCDVEAVETCVCDFDNFCCATDWDAVCVGTAEDACLADCSAP
jgi:hypothetical protein